MKTVMVLLSSLVLMVSALCPGIASMEVVKITASLSANHLPLVEAFNAAHKDMQVEFLQVKPVGQMDNVLVEHLAGAGPDVQFLEWYEYIDKFIDAGVFTSLQPFIAKDNMQSQMRDIPPVVVQRFSRNGELYAIPEYIHMRAVGMNRAYREEAGLPLPNPNWTWDDFRTYAKKLIKKDNADAVSVYGTTIVTSWPTIQAWLGATGVFLHKPGDPSVIDLVKPEIIKAFEFLHEVKNENTAYKSIAWGILGGKVAMQANMASNYAKNMHESMFDYDTIEHPLGPAGTRAIVVNDGSFFITKQCKNKEAAWEFLKFVYSREGQLIYMNTTGFQPARMSMVMEWKQIVQRKWPKMTDAWFKPFFNAYSYAQVTQYFTDSQVLTQYLNPMIIKLVNNGEPVKATLEATIPAANAFIAGRKGAKTATK